MDLQGFDGIFRTGGEETAGRGMSVTLAAIPRDGTEQELLTP
jgi:hypothetical protein